MTNDFVTSFHPLCPSYRTCNMFVFVSRTRSGGWPHHERTFSIYLCPLSFWLTLPRGVLSTSWCCPSRPCVVFLACVHVAFFLALSRQTPLFPHGVTVVCFLALTVSNIIIIIIIYSLKIGAGQQGRISRTYNCPQYKIKCRNIKYRELQKTRSQSQHSNSANTSSIVIAE